MSDDVTEKPAEQNKPQEHVTEPREWFAVLDSWEENEDGSINWAEGWISTHGGGNIRWETESVSFVEKSAYDRVHVDMLRWKDCAQGNRDEAEQIAAHRDRLAEERDKLRAELEDLRTQYQCKFEERDRLAKENTELQGELEMERKARQIAQETVVLLSRKQT